jgi:polyhydroxyalkanoate synthesis repressor PhaR
MEKLVERKKITIKRYANRKLYNTQQKEYISLNGITKLIHQDAEIEVIDNETGEDLTARTLTQIILEQEKMRRGRLSNAFLTNLIRAGEESLAFLQRNVQSSLNTWRQVDDEIRNRLTTLVKKGEISTKEAEHLVEKLLAQSPIHRIRFSEEKHLQRDGQEQLVGNIIPTKNDINQLYSQLEELTEKIDKVINTRQ